MTEKARLGMRISPKLSNGQLNRTSEVFGNISVAWFFASLEYPEFTTREVNKFLEF